ncbi:hypothetical protein PWEIH_00030 [Listeria weihenstephanensis FSL R9-0317]|uniref:DUF805 domain-containing protein n=1 Tax=Listeria weihenstephanensis TaxID=1006155 RepID=A0A1S7FSN9_9LIST|nr:DUF805 domain-containing protein [Listeria weihenstephanensis]AQY50402.1 hypothetical protein UE46_04745 [Listeria weihenstephanensis]EUJ41410.1 hypothetical protein PWEIH_00030 [Listeria weihenstephanensis FSL R9-0317]
MHLFFAYKLFWLNYAEFKGRSVRWEFWFVLLWHIAIFSILHGVTQLGSIFDLLGFDSHVGIIVVAVANGLLMGYELAIIVPLIALIVRRLHDMDVTGWVALVGLIPAIGEGLILLLMCAKSSPGPNKYDDEKTSIH